MENILEIDSILWEKVLPAHLGLWLIKATKLNQYKMLSLNNNHMPIFIFLGGRFRRSDGITAVTWCLAAFTFVQIYSSCLTSYTSLVFQRPGVVTFEDLATSHRHEVFTIKHTYAERLILVIYQINRPILRIFNDH